MIIMHYIRYFRCAHLQCVSQACSSIVRDCILVRVQSFGLAGLLLLDYFVAENGSGIVWSLISLLLSNIQ